MNHSEDKTIYTPNRSFNTHLKFRPYTNVKIKQNILQGLRSLPLSFQNQVKKILWPPPLRHMRYVVPTIVFDSVVDGVWILRTRGKNSEKFLSKPLSELCKCVNYEALVVATGPSANHFDWRSIADKRPTVWAVNGAPTILENQGLKCDFLVVTDHRFAREGASHIALAAKQGAALLFSYEAAAGFAETLPEILRWAPFSIFEKANAWFGIPTINSAEMKRINTESKNVFVLPETSSMGVGWSYDPVIGVFSGRTVTFAALQIVVWSGARKIDVVGLDLGGRIRAYKEEQPVISHLSNDLQNFIIPSFRCMASALAGRKIHIINHSTTSPLPHHLVDP